MRKRTILLLALLALSAIGTAAFALREKPAPARSGWPPRTPEYLAGFAGDQPIEWVRDILDEHPHYANARTVNGHSPLHNLASENKVTHLRLLLERGADPNGAGCNYQGKIFIETPLSKAAWRGHLEAGRVLLEFGADPNYSPQTPTGPSNPVTKAAMGYGAGKFIHLLHAAGADIDRASESGRAPLATAIQFLHAENVKALIACGADLTRLPNGRT